MRNAATALLVAPGILIGYAFAPNRAAAQANSPFMLGSEVQLLFGSGRQQIRCIVTFHDGDFIGCTRERNPGMEEQQNWYNLRFVERITTVSR